MIFSSLTIFAVAMIASALLTPVARSVSVRFGFLDRPEPRKLHRVPTPQLGGLAIYAATVIAIMIFTGEIREGDPDVWTQIMGLFAGATVLLMVGLLDDRGSLHPLTKLVLGMPSAALLLFIGGIRVTAWPFAEQLRHEPQISFLISLVFTLAWVIVITSAFSILDHMDGLCSGVAAISAAFFLLFAALQGQILVGIMAAAMIGSNIGFLFWNFNRAKIFMGDSGALFLGFMMATLSIKLRFEHLPVAQSWMIPVLVLGIPLFDTALVVVSRLRRRLNPLTSPGTDHAAHRLAAVLKRGHRRAVVAVYGLGIVLGTLSFLVSQASVLESYLLFAVVLVGGLWLLVFLERFSSAPTNHLEH